jgi:hypothetical protein
MSAQRTSKSSRTIVSALCAAGAAIGMFTALATPATAAVPVRTTAPGPVHAPLPPDPCHAAC